MTKWINPICFNLTCWLTKGVFGLEGVGEWKVEGEWEWKCEES